MSTESRDQRLESLIAAHYDAVDEGKNPNWRDLLAAHPDLAPEIQKFFGNDAHMAELVDRPAPPSSATPTHVGAFGESQARNLTEIPRQLGNYEIQEFLAEGGMGAVYRARQTGLNRIVALKVIRGGPNAGRDDLQRFRIEAEAAANLHHPNIVPIFEIGEHAGCSFFSMQLIEGGSLAEAMADGRWPVGTAESARGAAQLVATVSRAVHFAHQHGILHRDLKPGNILLGGKRDEGGGMRIETQEDAKGSFFPHPFVTDFGLAKRLEVDSALTQTGAIIGTPSYMAPEQAMGNRDLTPKTDVYSLGAILYHLLTGRRPFQAETPMATILQVQMSDPDRPRSIRASIPVDLETICLKCLDKAPERRYESVEALAEDLERWLRGEAVLAKPTPGWRRAIKRIQKRPGAVLAAAMALFVAAFAMFLINRPSVPTGTLDSSDYLETIERAQGFLNREENERAQRLLDACPPLSREWEWYYLSRLAKKEPGQRRWGSYRTEASCLVWNSDGSRLATAGDDGIKVWNATTGELVRHWADSAGQRSVAFLSDSTILDGSLNTRDIATGQTLHRVPSANQAIALCMLPGSRHAVTSDMTRVQLWDLKTGKAVWSKPDAGICLAVNGDGSLLATGGNGAAVNVYNSEDGKVVHSFRFDSDDVIVNGLAFRPHARTLVASCVNLKQLLFADLDTKAANVRTVTYMPRGLAFNATGSRLVCAGTAELVLLDGASGRDLLTVMKANMVQGFAVAQFSPDGRWLATNQQNGDDSAELRSPIILFEGGP